jgi:uncharacterized membrane protein
MRTPASIAGHPIHPMLVTLPIGLFVFSFVCDLIYVFGSGNPTFAIVALYTPEASGGYVWLSLIAIALLVVSGWLGGKMVYVYGVAVSGVGERARAEEPRSMREPDRRTRGA